MPHRQAYAGDPRQPVRQQLLAEGLGGLPAAVEFQETGEVFGGVRPVEADEMALPFGGLGRFVVEPDRGAGAADGVGGERDRVAGRVSETGGDLPQAGIEVLLPGDVGFGDLGAGHGARAGIGGAGRGVERIGPVVLAAGTPLRKAVQYPGVRQGAARDGLDVADLGVAEAEADGGLRAEAVGRGEDDQAAAGTDQRRAGPQQLPEGVVQRAGVREPFGQVVQGAEVGDPAGQPVLDGGRLFLTGHAGGRAADVG